MRSALLTLAAMQMPSRSWEETGLLIAMALTIFGSILHWKLPRKRMSFEERVKDEEMTEEQAERWIKIYSICAPLATFAGIAVLIAVLIAAMD